MAHHRLYFLDHGDRIADAADIDCVTDERAIAAARGQATGHKIEVWQRDRKVGLFEGPGDYSIPQVSWDKHSRNAGRRPRHPDR